MKTLRTSLFTALGLAGLTGLASANAFNINEHDPKVTGRGGATAASNADASSIVFNPGGLALTEGTQLLIGTSLYIAEGWYCDSNAAEANDCYDRGTRTDSAPAPVPNLYVAHRLNDMIALGVGVHFPFGLAVSYPDNHLQSTVAQDSDLKTMFVTPTVGLNLRKQVPGLSFGAGLDIVPSSVKLERALVFGEERGSVALAANAVGIGFRAGAMYHPPALNGKLKLGVMYRHKIKLDFEGEADIDIAEPFRSQVPPDGDASTTINLPAAIIGGVAVSPIDNLEVEFNAVWIQWSKTFSPDEDRGEDATSLSITLPDGSTSNAAQDYEDTVSYRLGLDYKLPKQRMNVRGGFIYDPTPIPITTQTAQLPDVNRLAFTLGVSHQVSQKLGLHASALYIPPRERDTTTDPAVPTFHGTYGVQALVLSVGISGNFGGTPPAAPPAATVAKN
ncbi:MAG: outer membrane protein transport protein [Deltaproteobacteria bacterium]|nr:outer membrane protein transport protein [Deltaproteobacteria bacterium]